MKEEEISEDIRRSLQQKSFQLNWALRKPLIR